jgi:probable phosphoglycerate mutase
MAVEIYLVRQTYENALARVSSWLGELEGIVVAVSHGLIGRLIRGAYLRLPRDEMLSLPDSHDAVWHLAGRQIAAMV